MEMGIFSFKKTIQFSKNEITTMNGEMEQEVNHLGRGSRFKGEIESKGNVRIDGDFEGKVLCSGKVVIGESGKVSGTVECQNADISGDVKIHIKVSGLLELRKTSKFTGEIIAKQISIEPGCQLVNTKVNFTSESEEPSFLFEKVVDEQSK